MSRFHFFTPILFIQLAGWISSGIKRPAREEKFHLRLEVVGYGSNRFRMQPVFEVDQNKFVFTMERAWKFTDSPDTPNDTLLIGNFRQSSIDSISALISNIKDSIIYKLDPYLLSGSAIHINIRNERQSLKFHLHNADDSTAEKILAILDTYSAEARRNYKGD